MSFAVLLFLLRVKISVMRVRVIVKTRSRNTIVRPLKSDYFKVEVVEAPEKGRANAAVVKALARHLHLAPSRISIIKGASSQNKVLEII